MTRLVYKAPNGATKATILDEKQDIALGRDPSNDIVFRHPSISRKHAIIQFEAGNYYIEDQKSRNEVFVNGQVVTRHQLRDGDVIVLGLDKDHPMKFSLDGVEQDRGYGLSRSVYDFSKEALNSLKNLKQLIQINEAISTSLELEEVLDLILKAVLEISSGMRAMVLLKNKSGEMEVAYQREANGPSATIAPRSFSRSAIKRVIETRQSLLINDLAVDSNLYLEASIGALDLHSIVAIPLIYSQNHLVRNRTDEDLMGILYVDSQAARRRFKEEDLDLLRAFSYQASISIENAQMHLDLRESYVALVTSLAEAVELKDRYTRGHSELVSRFGIAIGEKLSLTEKELEDLLRGGLLHDVGKIGIDESILNKPDKLTPEEFEQIKLHPAYGAQILQPIPYMANVMDMVLHHHERIDGKGYPDGLAGDGIKLGARIIAIADVFEALTAKRSYRKALTPKEVVKVLEEDAGSKLDPELVRVFLNLYRETGYSKGGIMPRSDAASPQRKRARRR